jgi:hypothetical protein
MESGFESLLPSHSDFSVFPWKFPFLSFNRVTIASALINRICHVFVTWNEISLLVERLTTNQKAGSSASKGLSQLGKTIVSFYKGYVLGILTLLYAIENVLLIPGDVAQILEIFFNVFYELKQAFLKFVIIVKTESRIMMASGLLEKPIQT